MASTPASAAPAPAPARRQPAARAAPPARVQRVPWTDAEKDRLKGYFEQAATTPVWNELAERLGTGRTGKQVQAMAAKLKLTEPVGRTAARGPAWDAQRCRRALDKNTKRKRASPAAASPVHDEPPLELQCRH